MQEIQTLGRGERRTTFKYAGDVANGVAVYFDSSVIEIKAETFKQLLSHFKGQTVIGGFSRTAPPKDSVGHYLTNMEKQLRSRYASFVCAILHHEGYIASSYKGRSVVLTFKP